MPGFSKEIIGRNDRNTSKKINNQEWLDKKKKKNTKKLASWWSLRQGHKVDETLVSPFRDKVSFPNPHPHPHPHRPAQNLGKGWKLNLLT